MYLRGPDEVDGGVRADGVGYIVGTVGERGGRGSHDLEKRVGVLSAVVVVLASSVDLLNITREEVLVLLLINDILLNTAQGEVLGPVPHDSGGVPGTWRGRLLRLRERATRMLVDDNSGSLWNGSNVRVAAVHLGLRYLNTALLEIIDVVVGSDTLVGTLSLELLSGQMALVKVGDSASSNTFWALARLRALEKESGYRLVRDKQI